MYYVYMGSVLLPITPEKMSLKVKNQNKTMTLINEGEVNFLKDVGLTEVEFDALIPAVQYPFAMYDGGFKSPSYFTNYFESLKVEKKPFQFIVIRQMPDGKMTFNNDITVSLESYTLNEQYNEGFDLIVSFKLKQYKQFGTKTLQVVGNTASVVGNSTTVISNSVTVVPKREQTSSPAPKQQTMHQVKMGDTLWSIAKKYYGDGSKYTAIVEVNKGTIKDLNSLSIGMLLVIPDVNTANSSTAKAQNQDKATADTYTLTVSATNSPSGTIQIQYYNSEMGKRVINKTNGTFSVPCYKGTTATVIITPKSGHSFKIIGKSGGKWTSNDAGNIWTCTMNSNFGITIQWMR